MSGPGFSCATCSMDTGGRHAYGCPNAPNPSTAATVYVPALLRDEAADYRARLAAAERERDEIREALRALADWCYCREGESETDRFERHAEDFRRATGFLRPGKSVPLAMGASGEEERRVAWAEWSTGKSAGLRDRARALLTPKKVE